MIRVTVTIDRGAANYDVSSDEEGHTFLPVATALVAVLGQMLKQSSNVIPTDAQKAAYARMLDVQQKHPAVLYWPNDELQLCEECVTRYAGALDVPGVPAPKGARLPCSYHLDPTLRPEG